MQELFQESQQVEQTFIMIKPDGVQRGLIGKIIRRFEEKNFKLLNIRMILVNTFIIENNIIENNIIENINIFENVINIIENVINIIENILNKRF